MVADVERRPRRGAAADPRPQRGQVLLRPRRRRHRRAGAGRAADRGSHRPQRRGQDDPHAHGHALAYRSTTARSRLRPARRSRDPCSRRCRPHRMARHGVVKSNQVIMDFDKLTIWDSVLFVGGGSALRAATARLQRGRRLPPPRGGDAALPRPTSASTIRPRSRCRLARRSCSTSSAASCSSPRFLLLDEPTAGLPDDITEKVMQVVRQLAAEGTSVVIVEHDLNLIWNLCDEVHFMAEGSVVLSGDPAIHP